MTLLISGGCGASAPPQPRDRAADFLAEGAKGMTVHHFELLGHFLGALSAAGLLGAHAALLIDLVNR